MLLIILNCIYHAHDTHASCARICARIFLRILLHELFITAQLRSVEPSNKRVLVHLEISFKARFLNGFIVILKML